MKRPDELNVQENVPLAPHSSWLVGGPAEFFAEPASVGELSRLSRFAHDNEIPMTVLGGGTNVLISDKGVKGLVVSLAKLSGSKEVDETKTWFLAGTPKSELLKYFLKKKTAPAKFLAGLPGQVGGGVVMNAGVGEKLEPREFHEITRAIEVVRPDGRVESIDSSELKWGYRHCEGWKPGIISRVLVSWNGKPDPEVLDEVKKLNQSRLQKQPLEWPSCGSVFRNPLPRTAGKLIEDAGLKGHIEGGAQISHKHANFIINKGNATAADIRALMDLCILRVKEKFGVTLHSEVVWLGETP